MVYILEFKVPRLTTPPLQEDARVGNGFTVLIQNADSDLSPVFIRKLTGPMSEATFTSFMSVARPLAETTIRVALGDQPGSV